MILFLLVILLVCALLLLVLIVNRGRGGPCWLRHRPDPGFLTEPFTFSLCAATNKGDRPLFYVMTRCRDCNAFYGVPDPRISRYHPEDYRNDGYD